MDLSKVVLTTVSVSEKCKHFPNPMHHENVECVGNYNIQGLQNAYNFLGVHVSRANQVNCNHLALSAYLKSQEAALAALKEAKLLFNVYTSKDQSGLVEIERQRIERYATAIPVGLALMVDGDKVYASVIGPEKGYSVELEFPPGIVRDYPYYLGEVTSSLLKYLLEGTAWVHNAGHTTPVGGNFTYQKEYGVWSIEPVLLGERSLKQLIADATYFGTRRGQSPPEGTNLVPSPAAPPFSVTGILDALTGRCVTFCLSIDERFSDLAKAIAQVRYNNAVQYRDDAVWIVIGLGEICSEAASTQNSSLTIYPEALVGEELARYLTKMKQAGTTIYLRNENGLNPERMVRLLQEKHGAQFTQGFVKILPEQLDS